MELRDYQIEAIEAAIAFFENSQKEEHGLIVVPTGGGKSIIQAYLIAKLLEQKPNIKICCVTHNKHLIEQNFKNFHNITKNKYLLQSGIFSAGLNQKDTNAQILFAGIQSIFRHITNLPVYDIILVDEAHLIPKDSGKMYKSFFHKAFLINPNVKVLGFTATPFRMDSGLLTDKPNNLFTDIIYDIPIKKLIAQGYLSRPVSYNCDKEINENLKNIHVRAGEYVLEELTMLMSQDERMEKTAENIFNFTKEKKKKVLIFCCSIEHAEKMKKHLHRLHHSVEVIHSLSSNSDKIIKNFRENKIKYLLNVNMLTTGFDDREIDCIVMLRPTKSPGLYYQMIGRGFRIHENKSSFLVLDFAGNIATHGAIDSIRIIRKTNGKKGEIYFSPVKTCPSCKNEIAISYKQCPECGYEFSNEQEIVKHDVAPSNLDVLSKMPELPKWFNVADVKYKVHKKEGKAISTLQVDYYAEYGIKIATEWICLNHSGFPKQKAVGWLYRRLTPEAKENYSINDCMYVSIPTFFSLFLEKGFIKKPTQILVDFLEKYPKVLNYKFD